MPHPLAPNPADRPDRPSKVYRAANVAPEEGGFAVVLDGRVAKTPSGGRLIVPTEALARLIAAEWDAQDQAVVFADMPATRLAFTSIDRTTGARAAVAGEVGRLIGADMLCYFAEGPGALVDRQRALWEPWLDWAARTHGLALHKAEGITHRAQPPETLAKATAMALARDDFSLSGLAFAGALYGSAVLALAVAEGALTGEAAFDLAHLDEAFQEDQWGVDAEAAERTARLRTDARMIGDWFTALNGRAE